MNAITILTMLFLPGTFIAVSLSFFSSIFSQFFAPFAPISPTYYPDAL
jgi:hypothetical protein